MMDYGGHMTTGGWIFSILGTLIILALIVGAIVWIVSNSGSRGGNRNLSASEILERRLATGEITIGQYDELHAKLETTSASSHSPPANPAGVPG